MAWWYVEAEDFRQVKVSGTYILTHDGITQRLVLHPDHTFEQDHTVGGKSEHAHGTWRVFSSTGHVAFSRDFINAPDSWRGRDEHEVYGMFKNYFGIVSLRFEADATSVTAFKKIVG